MKSMRLQSWLLAAVLMPGLGPPPANGDQHPSPGSEPPERVFSRTVGESAPKPGVLEAEGWTFATVTAEERSASERALEVLRSRMATSAIAALVRSCMDSATIPASTPPGIRRAIEEFGVELVSGPVSVGGVAEVRFAPSGDGMWSMTVACPTASLVPRQTTWSEIVAACSKDASASGSMSPVEAMLRLELAESITRSRVDAVVDSWERDWGSGISRTLRLERTVCLTDGWREGPPRLDSERLQALSPENLVQALARRPYDPDLLAALRASLKSTGWTRTAELLEPAQRLVRWDEFEVESPFDAPSARSGDDSLFMGPVCRVILRTGGTYPFEEDVELAGSILMARKAYDRGDFEQAVPILVASIEKCPDSDAMSLLAASLFEIGSHQQGLCFARAAWRMRPDHPYAGVNMLRHLRALGNRTSVESLLPTVREAADLDRWGRRQVADLESWVDE